MTALADCPFRYRTFGARRENTMHKEFILNTEDTE